MECKLNNLQSMFTQVTSKMEENEKKNTELQ